MVAPTDTVYWRLLWESPGNPAITRELVFNKMDIFSRCESGTDWAYCENALANGLINAGDSVMVKGIINPDDEDQVFVITISAL
jgi:hypothetical protein